MLHLSFRLFQKPGDSIKVPLIDDVRHLSLAAILLELVQPIAHSFHKSIMDLGIHNHMIAGQANLAAIENL